MFEIINPVSKQNQKMEKLPLTPSEDSQKSESISQTVSSSNEQLGTKSAKKMQEMLFASYNVNDSSISGIISNAISPVNEQIGVSIQNRIKVDKVSTIERRAFSEFRKNEDSNMSNELVYAASGKLPNCKGKVVTFITLTLDEHQLLTYPSKGKPAIIFTQNIVAFFTKESAKRKMPLSLKERGDFPAILYLQSKKGKNIALSSINPDDLQVLFRVGSRFRVIKIRFDINGYDEIYLNEI